MCGENVIAPPLPHSAHQTSQQRPTPSADHVAETQASAPAPLRNGFAACRGAELALAGCRGAAARTTVSHFHHTPNGSDCEGIVRPPWHAVCATGTAVVTALDDGLRLLCAACACLQGGRCAPLSEAHRPGPMSSRAVKRTGSCCASPRVGAAARRRSVRQRGGAAQTHR